LYAKKNGKFGRELNFWSKASQKPCRESWRKKRNKKIGKKKRESKKLVCNAFFFHAKLFIWRWQPLEQKSAASRGGGKRVARKGGLEKNGELCGCCCHTCGNCARFAVF